MFTTWMLSFHSVLIVFIFTVILFHNENVIHGVPSLTTVQHWVNVGCKGGTHVELIIHSKAL